MIDLVSTVLCAALAYVVLRLAVRHGVMDAHRKMRAQDAAASTATALRRSLSRSRTAAPEGDAPR